jgi:hypothetical protein
MEFQTMRKQSLFAGALVTALFTGSMLVSADGGPTADVSHRAQGAKKVVVATATSVSPRWRVNEFGDQLIVSLVGLQVEETLKGPPSNFLWLDVEGGTLNGVTLKVSSISELKPGDRAVFLLDETSDGSHAPHMKGKGILKLDKQNHVASENLNLDDIRRLVRDASK